MLRLTCPKCRKDSYCAEVESFTPCLYCGTIFSGKYGLYTRCEERIKQEVPFVFPYQGENLEAITVDLSERGAGIKIFGDPLITEGDIIDFTIGDFQMRAKVMWVRKVPDKSLAGLRRLN